MQFTRESIFVSAIRCLFNTFFSIIGIFVALILIGIIFTLGSKKMGIEVPDKARPIVAFDAEGKRDLLSDSTPILFLLKIQGIIGDVKLTSQNIISKLNDSQTGTIAPRIKGVLLQINTPGGSALESDEIYQALVQYKKKYNLPIYAIVEGLCASGGMYIASAADKILATPVSVIGSIGVVMGPNFNFFDLMGKMGVKALTLTEGKDKDALNPFRPWVKDEEAPLKALTTYYYNRFVDIVTKSRPQLDREKLIEDYGAKVFDAPMAEQYGYIDDSQSDYSKALLDLAKAAGIKEGEKFQVIELKIPVKVLSELFDGGSLLSKFKFNPLSGPLQYLYQAPQP